MHHSAAVLGDNSNAPRRLRQHQALHQDQNGWIDIAYHVAVDRNGNVYELRDAALAGDTGTDYDPAGHFLVLCEGNFDQETPTAAQVEGVARLCAYAYRRYGLRGAPGASISGHRDHVATACPGRNLYRRLDEIGARTHELLEAGGVGLSVWCGDGARARVAEIEAGQA